jgi:hypothetical protein
MITFSGTTVLTVFQLSVIEVRLLRMEEGTEKGNERGVEDSAIVDASLDKR